MTRATDLLGVYSYGWRDEPEKPIFAESEDWVPAIHLGTGGGYDWTDLHAFWSPSARRYFWASGSGCSCNSLGEDLRAASDLEDGDREALKGALRRFAGEHSYSFGATDLVDALDELARFEEVSA